MATGSGPREWGWDEHRQQQSMTGGDPQALGVLGACCTPQESWCDVRVQRAPMVCREARAEPVGQGHGGTGLTSGEVQLGRWVLLAVG